MGLISTEKHEKNRKLSDQTFLIYGNPKVGKSTLCSHFKDVLYIATEPGTNHLNLQYKPTMINSWKKFKMLAKEIKELKDSNFKTIVIDTVDELNRYCEDYILEREGISNLGDLPHGKAYGMVRAELMKYLKFLSMLPYGLVMVSHSKETEVEEKVGMKLKRWNKQVISVTGNRGTDITAIADIILYMTSTISEEGVQSGVAYTKPSPLHMAGERGGLLAEKIEYSPDDIGALYKIIAEAYSA